MFRIDATAVSSGIATAGSVPNTKSRMISAPRPPISVSPRIDGPLSCSPCWPRLFNGSSPVTCTVAPGGRGPGQRCARLRSRRWSVPKPGVPGRKISANVVCLSFETYVSLPVEKNELERAPGFAAIAASGAPSSTPGVFVTSPFVVTTATSGAFETAAEVLQRALVRLVGGVAGDRERLEPALGSGRQTPRRTRSGRTRWRRRPSGDEESSVRARSYGPLSCSPVYDRMLLNRSCGRLYRRHRKCLLETCWIFLTIS